MDEEEEVTTIELKREEGDPKYITVPARGGTLEITKGDLVINFYTGEIFLPDGTESDTSQSLRSFGVQHARSIVVNADKEFTIQLDDGGKKTIKLTEAYAAKRQKFQSALITVTATTKVRIWASTDPDASIEIPKMVVSGGTIKDNKFNEAVVAATDIFSAALAPAYPITIFRIYAAFDTDGVLSVRRTYNGTTVSEKLNTGANLSADCSYAFDILVVDGQTINLQFSVSATALSLIVSEVV